MLKGTASARNRSLNKAQEKGNTRTPSAYPDVVTLELAALYLETLGLRPWTTGWFWRPKWISLDGRRPDGKRKIKTVGRGWLATRWPNSPSAIRAGLAGAYGVDLRDQRSVRFVSIDVDCHDLPPPHDTIDGWLESSHATRKRQRISIAERARPIIEAVRAATPGVTWLALASPRGIHLVALLTDPVDVGLAEQIARGVIERAGSPPNVEPFPRAEAGGRTCRLPLTGGSRLLADDLVRPRHRRRAREVVCLLGAPKVPVQLLAPGLVQTAPAALIPARPARPTTQTALAADLPGDAELRARLGRHLRGREFRTVMRDLVRSGMPDDSSYNAAQKLAALMTYAGVAHDDAVEAGRAFVARPGHRATHAHTDRGRKEWMRTYRAELKHQRNGVDNGDVKPGGMRAPELVELVAELLGREPAKRRMVSIETARARAAKGGKARWTKKASAA